jgi:hypothetical protein
MSSEGPEDGSGDGAGAAGKGRAEDEDAGGADAGDAFADGAFAGGADGLVEDTSATLAAFGSRRKTSGSAGPHTLLPALSKPCVASSSLSGKTRSLSVE